MGDQKIAESMLKKTHFTESEIDRLSDLHANILVRIFFFVFRVSDKADHLLEM